MGNMTHDGIGQATSLSTETRPLPTVSLVPISDADQPANVGAVRIAAASSGSNVSLFPDISGASAAGKGSAPAVGASGKVNAPISVGLIQSRSQDTPQVYHMLPRLVLVQLLQLMPLVKNTVDPIRSDVDDQGDQRRGPSCGLTVADGTTASRQREQHAVADERTGADGSHCFCCYAACHFSIRRGLSTPRLFFGKKTKIMFGD